MGYTSCNFNTTSAAHISTPIWPETITHSTPSSMNGMSLFLIAPLINLIRGSLSRSEEHTSELQSRFDLVCRLLLEKKKKYQMEWSINRYSLITELAV